MLELNPNPVMARQEMTGLIFYLAAFSYIDGEFDPSELGFIETTIRRVLERRVDASPHGADPALREALVSRFAAEFDEVFEAAKREVTSLLSESVMEAESRQAFVANKLKERCLEVYLGFDPAAREQLLAAVGELLVADGHAHEAELQLRDELVALLNEAGEPEASLELRALSLPPLPVQVREHDEWPHQPADHPYFARLERRYTADAAERVALLDADQALIRAATEALGRQRAAGQGRLAGLVSVDQLAEAAERAGARSWLDGYVHALMPRPGHPVDVTVLGDLHGCYSCFKAALMQARFFEKLVAFERDPAHHPDPVLILLGDYLDRGAFGFEGVMRLALDLFVNAPDHVVLLRGNHEIFVEHEGTIHSAVRPAESISSLRPIAPRAALEAYMHLFEVLPCVVLFGRLLLVHGGVPRDVTIKERLHDLAGLNDPQVLLQMLWSDPSSVDVIPRTLQDGSYRFAFGRLQCQGFLRRLGCHTLIRGHDKVDEGCRRAFDDPGVLALTLFSAGGAENRDLPPTSAYRRVTPKALTIGSAGGLDDPITIDAWPIDWAPYNSPALNGFYREAP